MALFKSKDEKELKKEEKLEKLLEIYKVNNLYNKDDEDSIKEIVSFLSNNNLIELGSFLTNDINTVSRINANYNRAIVEQNFIIIKQLDRLCELLKKS